MKNKETFSRINSDIFTLIQITSELGWNSIREKSINRIIYLSSVLYGFVNNKEENIFEKDYNFEISLTGPYCNEIVDSILFLQIDKNIVKVSNDSYQIGITVPKNIEEIDNYHKKKEWLKVIVNILSIYGEEKIYDFVFRDPEYQEKLSKNSTRGIDISKKNNTIKNLERFREVFEKNIIINKNIESSKYLELYFDYVFSVIIRGDTE